MLEVVKHPAEVLRAKAEPIQEVNEEIAELAQEMLDTMEAADGIGLAAPQVNRRLRMFVCHVKDDERRVFINPEIIGTSMETVTYEEGCLSVPGVYADIERSASIEVQARNERGRRFRLDASGLLARVILHETDHLNGVLFFDHLSEKQRDKLLKRYDRQQKHERQPQL
jgi:peptide deformylase